MSRPAPSIADRTKNWFRLLKRRTRLPAIHPDEKTGAFSNAHDFTISGGQVIDASYVNEMKINYITSVISSKDAVFELLEPYACLDATKDSSARHPPPRCHPETRLKIRDRLKRWLTNEDDEWKMLWVRGSAGTGKSAVAQSFGDSCEEEKKHGASYFFSRTAGRNKLKAVVPTIVYQLAITIPEYRSLVGHQLANNPLLLRNSPPVQFRELIVKPFSILQRQCPRKPVVVILDGLDECEGEDDQLELLEMITNALRTNPDLPLRWLIFSRPEAHLKDRFSKYTDCGRDELVIDAECREDVEKYIRERIADIKDNFSKFTPPEWPPADKLQELIDTVSGLFVFASTCLNFIGDREEANPQSQLDSLLTFMHRSQGVVSRNPLAVLDLLYSRILDDIPPAVFNITRRILAYMSLQKKFYGEGLTAQALCNFLQLDQHTFYKAVRGLHSVMYIPEPLDAVNCRLQFHHASFLDFLLDPHRSGKFVMREHEALVGVMHCGCYWNEVDVTLFHSHRGWYHDREHRHDSLPGLTWASEDNQLSVSQSITSFLEWGLFDQDSDMHLDGMDIDLLSQISNLDFKNWDGWNLFLLARLCQLDPSTSLVRIQPSGPVDYQLLEYFNLVIGNGIAKPATFPLRKHTSDGRWIREYFFIGNGVKSAIVWITKSPGLPSGDVHSLCCDEVPSEAQISDYRECLDGHGWDEEKVKLEMK